MTKSFPPTTASMRKLTASGGKRPAKGVTAASYTAALTLFIKCRACSADFGGGQFSTSQKRRITSSDTEGDRLLLCRGEGEGGETVGGTGRGTKSIRERTQRPQMADVIVQTGQGKASKSNLAVSTAQNCAPDMLSSVPCAERLGCPPPVSRLNPRWRCGAVEWETKNDANAANRQKFALGAN